MKSIFSKDAFSVFKDRKLVVALIAILFVPILYAGMFLWAFWDPYAFLDDIPVAVVNEDEGYTFEGEHLTLGKDLVDELKDSADFDFHFVTKEEGYSGLEKQDYYILIEIPRNFSKHSTTVLDDTPEQLELVYVPNESYNFLASQMGETAMLQIEQALEEEVIESYANILFEAIDEVRDGLADAKDATIELDDGALELKDGSETLSEHLQTLAESTVTFKEGMYTAKDGVVELAEGSDILASGVHELYDNSVKLKDASIDLQDGAGQISAGLKTADDGVQTLRTNIPQLIDGTKQIQGGLQQFHEQLPKQMADELTTAVKENKDPVREMIDDLIKDKTNEWSPVISDQLTTEIASGASTFITESANEIVNDLPDSAATTISETIIKKLQQFNDEKLIAIKEEITDLLEDQVPEEILTEVIGTIDEYIESIDLDSIENEIESSIQTALNEALDGIEITEAQQKELETLIAEKAGEQIEQGVEDALSDATNLVDDALDEYEDILLDNVDDLATTLQSEVKTALNEPMGLLQDGVSELQAGHHALYDGVKDLADGTDELAKGSVDLKSGQDEYVDNMNRFTSSFVDAKDGAFELSFGVYELFDGMNELAEGSDQLEDGAGELYDGSEELVDGMSELTDGTEEFRQEMTDAVDEVDDVNTTEKTEQMIANPVRVDNEKINEVPNYGTGFAPYFLSLGLFVGALLLSIVYPLREPSSIPSSGTTWFLRKFLVLLVVGVLQALIASAILLLGLGLEVQSVPLFLLYAIITSITFVTLIQFFVTTLDDPGRFIAILILILQLTTSAGTFPLELIPKVLQPLNAVLPMTYSVAGFKAVVSSGDYAVMWQNAGILFIFIAIFVLLTWAYFVAHFKRKYARFHQEEETA